MSDIEDYERRIAAAMDRIATGLDGLTAESSGEGDGEEIEALKTALDEERTANAQLEERVGAIKDKQEARQDALESASTKQGEALEKLDGELQRLRAANAQLRENNQALRAANEAGVGEAHLINKSMLAELEALRAARAADIAEAEVIMGALTPLVEGAKRGEEA